MIPYNTLGRRGSVSGQVTVSFPRVVGGGKDVKTLVGFGDFSQQHGLTRGHPTTPILRLKRELRNHFTVVGVDEYNTSKTCSSCNEPIELYRNRIQRRKWGVLEPTTRMSNIHSVIRCKHNECSLCCMDRDINASRNIWDCSPTSTRDWRDPIVSNRKNDSDTSQE